MSPSLVTITIALGGRVCRKCGFDRENGMHLTLAECERLKESDCEHPEEHHRFGRRWIRVEVDR